MQMSPKDLILQERDRRVRECDMTIGAEVRKQRRCYTAGFEDGGRGHEPKECRHPLEAGKGKKQISVSKRNAVLPTS